MQLELLNDQGQAASKFEAPETVFGRAYNEDLVHQIVVAYQANANGKVSISRDFAQKTSISLKDLRNSQPKFTPTVRGFYTVNLVGLTKQGNVKKAVAYKSPPIRVV